ncbi:ATP-dependent DNA helicase RecG [Accumulibacter sp.]|uniref:ATP-dependent DNA helicase RecG n=1 Tax=Accumulibacter sp. TaxID=2053492 RepID=UPI0025D1B603|nr:ATP-dependent DNA helicase RecG [Accumulibacter sp.]MCM8595459.1 ATP-dependent DNA helicase RecG [Accumulibacter sp.]MCM8626361.1 ATP-dependent DNA helicase RecG [Accumulibacter sp.]MDS4049606.1 ATP-dependent DNA helicase RecG [Accumulibacter sp.]
MPDGEEIAAPPAILKRLYKLGLQRRDDLVLHLPLRYEDETQLTPIAEAPAGGPVQVEGRIVDVVTRSARRRELVVRIDDGSGLLDLRFLSFYGSQQRALETARDQGSGVRAFGEVRFGVRGPEMIHPRLRIVAGDSPLPEALTPVYPTTAGLGQTALRSLIARALAEADLGDSLDADWCREHSLPALADALRLVHSPPPETPPIALGERSHPAWRRIKLDELLAQQIALRRGYLSRREQLAPALQGSGRLASRLRAALPFALTAAQQRVVDEIAADLACRSPMQRLLQGDVGCGKTIVAAITACQAIEAGYQTAFMAPTEILAAQHFAKLSAWLEPLDVGVLLLTGEGGGRAKRERQREAARAADLVVGTHALIQDSVDFSRLGLVIIDEQHRFGVAQRLELRRKGDHPHQLMMSATPIPRTLAMSYCGDLDVSVIDELPPGRSPVRTRLFSDGRRGEVIAALRSVAAAGRQAYWVCPLIEESAALDLQPALDTHAVLSEELSELRIGLVHGRLHADEKAAVMDAFSAGGIDVLVATTVIEVGVDVPNASLMVIEHAERFGLAQLHQLRGRVGRGAGESLCVLLYQPPLSAAARARLRVIFEHADGFEIARQDLRLRGPGEFIGSRQAGVPLLRYADLEADADLVDLARATAVQLLREEPERATRHLRRWLGTREELLGA